MRKGKSFESPFIGIEEIDGISVLYHNEGHYSAVLEIKNPILQYSGDENLFYDYHRTLMSIVKILGEKYILQKQDIFFDQTFKGKTSEDFLSQKYFEHFEGRKFKEFKTYLTITRKIKRNSFFTANERDFENFVTKIHKVIDVLKDARFYIKPLNPKETSLLLKKFSGFSFNDTTIKRDNIEASRENLRIRSKVLKTISLIDIDEINFPNKIKPYSIENLGFPFPVDLCSFISKTPYVETVVYNQVISIPNQKQILSNLERKKKRHGSMPDPANDLAVKDIDLALENIARNNELLVNSHYNIMLYGNETDVTNGLNFIDLALSKIGINPSERSTNQLELFRASHPGNTTEYNEAYDFFTMPLSAAVCLLYKETRQVDEDSKFQVYFTDREGLPVAIDTSDLPMQTNRINNRNKFVLGPSGSGKSFLMNHLIRQYVLYNTDVVLIDTGHSYSGICDYYGGSYITYTEEKPITMNPFKLVRKEYNEEKRAFLKSLIILLWKGANDTVTKVEDTAVADCINAYYKDYFEDETKSIDYLSFNSFYEFSLVEFKRIMEKDNINLDLDSYKFVTKQFYKGGQYDTILNSDVDDTLFDEKFIVFEIDGIKDNEILFPITTIIIMDVFLQKMRNKKNRKALIIEEAWKAIASPNMAIYIVFLYKTVRKFFGEAVIVTQELGDIIGNQIVKDSIISNSDTTILLDQSKFREHYDEVSELLNLSRTERNKIFTINQLDNKGGRSRFKEVYIKRGDRGEVYGVEVSIFEYLTFTTEKKEKDALAVYLDRYSSYQQALEHFVADLKVSKLSIPDFADQVNLLN